MLGFLFIAVEKGKVNIMGRDFTMKDMVEKYKKTYKKGVSWDKKVYKDGIKEILNLQPKNSNAKAYQVKQVRNIIIQYKIKGE